MRWRVAFFASQVRVFAFQLVAGQAVIEFFFRRLPPYQAEILAVVVQMAVHAIPPVRVLHLHLRVVAVLVFQRLGDLFVAIQAFKRRRAGAELMAAIALGGAAEGLVRLGEWTGRNLRPRERRKNKGASSDQHHLQDDSELLAVFARRPEVGSTLAQESLRF